MVAYINYAVALLLLAATLMELRKGRIPNWLTALPFVLFIAALGLTDDRGAMLWQIAAAAVVFVLGLGLFAIGGMGAGAVKLLAGTALFVPLSVGWKALAVLLVGFFVWAFVIVQWRKLLGRDDSAWHVMAHPVIPLSVPISLAGVMGMFVL